MSRVYDDQPLLSIPVNTHQLTTAWEPGKHQKGAGVILEGTIEGRSRHVIIDNSQNKFRYLVLHVRPNRAHRRKFDAAGREVEPNFSDTWKVNTGYLHSSYKVEARGQTDRLSTADLEAAVTSAELSCLTHQVHRHGCLPFWMQEEELAGMELNTGDSVRLKTRGDGPFIYNVAQLDGATSQVSNFAGGDMVGSSWTEKVMAVKQDQQERREEENQGVEEDEWDD
ncbi:ARPIN [Branchiostoma lanceolatum]|uniref:Arpin n=1 Tax=Branchiostoma lanceolatum TaxID=7740 RepID=A0A8K0ES29_BRALA|nr:ARPIN [Branchiostoma lanceolatum]